LFFYRFFVRRVDEIVIEMEQEAIKLVDVMHSDRVEKAENKTPKTEPAKAVAQ